MVDYATGITLNKMKKIYPLLFCITFTFLLSLSLLSAVESSTDPDFRFRLYENSTLEISMSNADFSKCLTCTCEVSLFYPNGSQLVKNDAGNNVLGFCHYSFVPMINGKYDGELYFTDGADYGRGTFDIEVTSNGKPDADGIIVVVYTIIFIAILFFGLLYFIKALDHVTKFEMDLTDLTVMMSTYLCMWIFYYFSKEYLGNSFINDMLDIAIIVGGFTHIILAMVGFLVSYIMTNLKFKQKASVTY